MDSTAEALARWAHELDPDPHDLALARRSLLDTLAVTLAARDDELVRLSAELPDAARWAAVGHVLDFDDLHVESTTHISVVCVPATLAAGGDARAYLAGAGVMARIGVALGWSHYSSGWHATCTAGAPAAAVCAGVALGLSAERLATAMALAVPAAGGVQRAFGTSGKSLQVGFAAEAGVRAARLAAAGATADPTALDAWLRLVGGDPDRVDLSGPAVPGGLAIKMFPCCYALQRPISALREQLPDVEAATVEEVRVRTPAGTVQPLIHHRPSTGLQGKFSMEYAVAAALLDPHPGFASFTDEAVTRAEAQRLVRQVTVDETPGGDWLLDGRVEISVRLRDGTRHAAALELPPGSPGRPPSDEDLTAKITDCGAGSLLSDVDWCGAAPLLAEHLPGTEKKEPA
ncbi:MmgE/PrpD family protein [Saccharopolyspora sp. TS4A08]|uniref:MmgE/PrpD family protein n=1 Tax=Saccharopolyspora ipomoeae TaxID=3042027 RepID=A0ABT6PRB2_9PSEU|nr:MmgE/PrpD family protein [Saccharopolyspora sp. TS4A08]MDI2030427.1 MmgE/PrpD family protein [Saccharopolyspora sp. TS4A08]